MCIYDFIKTLKRAFEMRVNFNGLNIIVSPQICMGIAKHIHHSVSDSDVRASAKNIPFNTWNRKERNSILLGPTTEVLPYVFQFNLTNEISTHESEVCRSKKKKMILSPCIQACYVRTKNSPATDHRGPSLLWL